MNDTESGLVRVSRIPKTLIAHRQGENSQKNARCGLRPALMQLFLGLQRRILLALVP
jgi:hypothetical protein